MKTLLTNIGQFVEVDFEEQTANVVACDRESISRIYLITEKCIVKDEDREIEAKPGDIVIRFYTDDFGYKTVIAKSKDWAKNIKDYRDKMEELRKTREECGDCECACPDMCLKKSC